MLRNNSDMPKTLKNKMVSGNPRPYPINICGLITEEISRVCRYRQVVQIFTNTSF